jgi:hypothetical protein
MICNGCGRDAGALFNGLCSTCVYFDHQEKQRLQQNPPRLIWPINPTSEAIQELGAACSNCGRVHDVSGRITGDRIWCPCGHWLTVQHPARITS